MTAVRRAAFIDRDSVLNFDHGYMCRREDFEWLPGAVEVLSQLQSAGYALDVVTNQSGIAGGLYSEAALEQLHRFAEDDLQRQGVRLTDIYACPHHLQAALATYRLACECRKPQPITRSTWTRRACSATSPATSKRGVWPVSTAAGWSGALRSRARRTATMRASPRRSMSSAALTALHRRDPVAPEVGAVHEARIILSVARTSPAQRAIPAPSRRAAAPPPFLRSPRR